MALHQGPNAVGVGFEVGDLVWGKAESHPWWPGYIYHEGFACHPSVMKTKVTGHVLVVFFQDRKFGWFLPSELIPFEENYEKMVRQSSSKNFVIAVEEANYELCRMRGLGLACRCRNKSNFSPSKVEQYLEVDVGDGQSWPHSLSQISKARNSFQPSSMLCFVQHLALTPMNVQHRTLDFIKNKATVLAWRKAQYDETHAHSFEAHLSEGSEKAEALGMGKLPVKPIKTNNQLERNKRSNQRKSEKDRVHKRPGVGLSFERASLAENKKKSSTELVQIPLTGSLGAEREKFSANPLQIPLVDETPAGQNTVVMECLSYPEEFRQVVQTGKNQLGSRVYKKRSSLNQASAACKQVAVSATSVKSTATRSSLNPVRPLSRPCNPIKGGIKCSPLEHIEQIRNKVNDEGVKNDKQHLDLEEIGKKKLRTKVMDSDLKILSGEMKMLPAGGSSTETSHMVEQSSIDMNPTKLVMKFPPNSRLPSAAELNIEFHKFGALDSSATRVFKSSSECLLVYKYKAGAEAALKFSIEIFRNSNVHCSIEELAAKVAGHKPDKFPKEFASVRESQPQVQLKSCLKKPARRSYCGDGQGPSLVKFSKDGEESRRYDQFHVAGSSSAANAGSRNLQSCTIFQPNAAYNQRFPVNLPFNQQHGLIDPPASPHIIAPLKPNNDISQRMIHLLERCYFMVENLKEALKNKAYRPL